MPQNKLIDLNNHLFAQLERLDDQMTKDEVKIEIEKARAVAGIASQIIKTARLRSDINKIVESGVYSDNEEFRNITG